ncbi:MAG: hypothetical protein LBT75_05110 [Bacilli bacterium]|jgi:uncharacterized protein YkwD|nr:hypothetical protein [Bacilli bacterium]
MIKKYLSKKTIRILLVIILLIPIGYFSYASIQIRSLEKLGYTNQQAKDMVNPFSIYNIVSREIDNIEKDIINNKTKLKELGLSEQEITLFIKDKNLRLKKKITLQEKTQERLKLINTLILNYEKQAKEYNIKYSYQKDANVYQKYLYIKKLITNKYKELTTKYQNYLLSIGYSQSEINKYKSKDSSKTIKALNELYLLEKENEKKFQGFSNNLLKEQAMKMYHQINVYRQAKGLKPYTYNNQKQTCVFKEARAYARNKNPHNWACPCANENASLASVNSNYVNIAMNFFKNDPPHERVISGNYKSTAIAFVETNGMVYMIVDVFY